MDSPYFKIRKLSSSIGAEVVGLDLTKPLSKDTVATLRQCWLEHKLLVFRDQALEPHHQLSFTQQFGTIDRYPFLHGLDGYPDVAPVLKRPEDEVNFGGVWHSDTTYMQCPAAGATLYALEVPEKGGDTIFVNMAAVYTALPQDLKRLVTSAVAENISGKAAVSRTRNIAHSNLNSSSIKAFKHCHPVIRTHPETGEKILYVNEAHTTRIVELPAETSDQLLHKFFAIISNSQFRYQLKWETGTLVMWDNRSTQHFPLNDYPGCRRLLHRVSLKGDQPF